MFIMNEMTGWQKVVKTVNAVRLVNKNLERSNSNYGVFKQVTLTDSRRDFRAFSQSFTFLGIYMAFLSSQKDLKINHELAKVTATF